MPRVIAVYNIKGGIGKTTTAVNLAASLAGFGKGTLLVDFDPQGNASSSLGVSPFDLQKSVYHGVLGEADWKELIRNSPVDRLSLIPSSPHLAGALVELVGMREREYALERFLHEARNEYDYVILDLAPNVSLLTVNALVAADEVLIPVQAEYLSLEGLAQLVRTIGLMKENMGRALRISGAVLTMTNAAFALSEEVVREVRNYFPYTVFRTEIPRCPSLAEAPSFGIPAMLHKPESPGSRAYRRLAQEVIAQEALPIPGQKLA